MNFTSANSKDEALRRLNAALGLALDLGLGSSIPTAVFSAATAMFDLDDTGSMPARAERVVHAAGLAWTHDCDSRGSASGGGSTVTLIGMNRLLEAVEQVGGSPNALTRATASLGVPYTRMSAAHDTTPASLNNDLGAIDRATLAQRRLADELADFAASRGADVRSPSRGEPMYDLAWNTGDFEVVVVVKSTVPKNHRQQVRLGFGELLECTDSLERTGSRVKGVLAITGLAAHVDDILANRLGLQFIDEQHHHQLVERGLLG